MFLFFFFKQHFLLIHGWIHFFFNLKILIALKKSFFSSCFCFPQIYLFWWFWVLASPLEVFLKYLLILLGRTGCSEKSPPLSTPRLWSKFPSGAMEEGVREVRDSAQATKSLCFCFVFQALCLDSPCLTPLPPTPSKYAQFIVSGHEPPVFCPGEGGGHLA